MKLNTYTNEEAAKKACIQNSGKETQFACMGERCMAWRYAGHTLRGYCGMAGPVITPTDELLEKWPRLADVIKAALK